MKVATVCRDEGAGEVCMRGTVATKSIRVSAQNYAHRLRDGHVVCRKVLWLPCSTLKRICRCQIIASMRQHQR